MPRQPTQRAQLHSVDSPTETPYEFVNHPPHYNQGSIECIAAIESMLTPEEFVGFLKGTIVRYQWRMGAKPGEDMLNDVRKCQWYVNTLVEYLQASEPEPQL